MSNLLNSPRIPPLYDVLTGLKSEIFKSLRCCLPAKIIKYDPDKSTVDVEITLKQQNTKGEILDYPPVSGCPLITLQGGGIGVQFPIVGGDECLVFFSDRCIDAWFQTGSAQKLPNLRMHNLSDGFVIVGVNSLAKKLNLALEIGEGGLSDSKARIAISGGKIAISNDVQNLSAILKDLITTLAGLSTVSGGTLIPSDITALNAFTARISALLYP